MPKHYQLLTLIILLASALDAEPKRPAWVDAKPQDPHLFQGIGTSEDTGSAETDGLWADQNARTEILQGISSIINSEISTYYAGSTHDVEGSAEHYQDVFAFLSRDYAEASIGNIQIVERFHDIKNKVYYSYATLDVENFRTQMSRQASEASLYAEERLRYARAALKEGRIPAALHHLDNALSHVMVAQALVKNHLEGDVDGHGTTEFLDVKLAQELLSIIDRVRFIKLSGDGQKGERDQALREPLTGKLTYALEGSQIPLSSMPLSVRVLEADAEYNPSTTTDKSGEFATHIDKLLSASSATPSVNINFNFPGLQVYLSSPVAGVEFREPVGLQYTFSMDVSTSALVFVRVLEVINGEPESQSKSEGTLINAMEGQQYTVIEARRISRELSIKDLDFSLSHEEFEPLAQKLRPHADYAIVGIISSETSSTGTLNYAIASAKINVIDLKSGSILLTANQSGLKAAGNTEKKAHSSALKKASNAAIAELLAGLESVLH